jgi:hypothetical protein
MNETQTTVGTSRSVALITGSSAGIGAMFARKLAERGYDLILVARRKGRLDELAAELAGTYDIDATALPADLTRDEDVEAVTRRIAQTENFEFLVNNAGFGTVPFFVETEIESQEAMVRLHVLATMRLTHAALGGLIARDRGFIVNVSSVAGFFSSPSNVVYCATKAWINNFTAGLAVELEKTGVTVQALCPGFTYSEFHDVTGMDRASVPRTWWLSAEYVVDESLKALAGGKLYCIPSLRYKLITKLLGSLPRPLRNYLAGERYQRMKKYPRSE